MIMPCLNCFLIKEVLPGMNVTITGRHMEMTDALKAYIENGLGKLRAHFDKVIDVDVVLSVEKHRHIAEINLHANGVRVHGKEQSPDMYASVDAVMSKLDKQIRRYRDRINRHQPRHAREVQHYGHDVIELLPEAAPVEGESAVPGHRVIEHERVVMKPMSVQDAAMQLDLIEDTFLVFTNADTQNVNVIYSRDDGTYGLIERQF